MDKFETYTSGLESPATDAFAIAPADGADLAQVTRAIYVGTAGNLVVRMKTGGTVTFKNMSGGMVLAVRAVGVEATGTTAADIVGLA
ncbi:MAG: hypothetical protein RLN89_04295 [Parvibaculum sp.]